MRINREGLEIIKTFEGLELTAYVCPAGILTIGYGHTGPDVYEGQTITEQEAERLLSEDLSWAEDAVNSLVTIPLFENQFSALVSFVFNVGVRAFSNSTLLRKLNKGDIEGAAKEFKRWNKANGKILGGLVARREAERELFLTAPIKTHGDYYGR